MITQRVSTKILLALAVSSAVLLAGCSGGSTAQAPQAPAPAPTAETPTPTVPALAPPVLSTQARQPSQAGAEAFVQYWWDLYSYAIQTNDADALMAQSSPECNYCTKTRDDLIARASATQILANGAVSVISTSVSQSSGEVEFIFETPVSQEDSRVLDSAGAEIEKLSGGEITLFTWVQWLNGSWKVRDIGDSAGTN